MKSKFTQRTGPSIPLGLMLLLLLLMPPCPQAFGTDEPSPSKTEWADPTKALTKGEVELGFLEEQADQVATGWFAHLQMLYRTQVRLAFRHSGAKWLPYYQQFRWDVTSETLHQIAHDLSFRTRIWYVVDHAKYGLPKQLRSSGLLVGDLKPFARGWIQPLVGSTKDYPEMLQREQQFRGWMGYPVKHPMILLSRPPSPDPEKWRSVDARGNPIPREIFSSFIEVPEKNVIPSKVPDPSKEPNWPYWNQKVFYSISDLEIRVELHSEKGDAIYGISFKEDAPVDQGDEENRIYYFFCLKGSKPRHIGKFATMPIGMGDFDGDGKTEFILKYTVENEDGYTIFWDDFTKSAKTYWHYH